MNKVYDLIIIGGGPAGIAAGIYAVRQKLNTLLIAKSFGGQVARKAVDIENYLGFEKISGMELIKKFEKHLRKFKIDIERDSAIKIKKNNKFFFVFTKSKHKFQAKTIIIASGVVHKQLNVLGEKKFIGKGVSFCSVCDGPLFSNKVVVVIGGGDAGFEAAIVLSKWAKKIYILEYNSKVTADMENQEIVKKTGKVEIIINAILKQIKGKNFVDSIIYQDRKSKKNNILKVKGVFVEIGSIPSTDFIKDSVNIKCSPRRCAPSVLACLVDFNKKGEIKINPKTCITKTSGLFAAGDVTEIRDKQIVIAAGQGAKAALSVYEYLQNKF